MILVLLVCSRGQAGDKLLDERRTHIETMSAVEKEHLRRNYDRFLDLDEREREKLRDLQAKIATGSESERLSSVMRLYHQWLKSLTAGERLPLLSLPAEQRIQAIKRLIERQERDRFQSLVKASLSVEDLRAIFEWLAELALDKLPIHEQMRLRSINQPLRRRGEIMSSFRHRPGGMSESRLLERLKPSIEDRRKLVKRLSQAAQDVIAAAKDDLEKRQLIQEWVNAALDSRRSNRPRVAPEALDGFYADLDASERDYLDNLPPDRKRQELEQLFLRNRNRRPGESRGPRGPFGSPPRRRGGVD
jgi:hypothetical protein